MNEQYGSSVESMLRDLIKRVEKIEAALRSGPGMQIGKASGSFNIPSTGYPGVPSSGAELYVSGSSLRVVDSSGTDRPVGGSVTPGDTPQYPTSFSSPATVTGTVTDTVYNALRADCAMLQVCLRDVINEAAATGLWPSP